MKRDFKVIIIGSGFGGQLAAINLSKLGIQDYLILERRAFMGGTWSQNVYPGAAVDVPSPLYSLSMEPYDWTQMFSAQKELNQYTDFIIEKHQLKQNTLTNSNVTKIQWLQSEQCWQVMVQEQQPFKAQLVINASGPLSTPVIPDFAGRESFKGKSFHSNNWDNQYDYQGKRVAIIGSGASAAQIIPEIAKTVGHLHVLQRTPHWVIPRGDYTFRPWQRKLLRHKWAYNFLRNVIYWIYEYRILGFKYSQKILNLLGRRVAEKLIKKQINDPKMRNQVTPDFQFGCKRVILSNTLYPAYCQSNVSLVDKNNGIQKITKNGIMTKDGKEIELDLIIYATGYDATDGVISYPVVGIDGKTLTTAWEQYPRAYLGTSVPDFPNLFLVTGPNTGIGHTSALFLIESQMSYIMNCISNLEKQHKKVIQVRQQAEDKYTTMIHQEMIGTVWENGGCNSWYKSKSGKVIAIFPGFSFTYRRWAKKFIAKDHLFDGI